MIFTEVINLEGLSWKTKIVVLWLISAEAMSAHMIMVTIDPVADTRMLDWGTTINASPLGAVGWLFGAIYWLIPLWMAFATVTLKSASNRRANFVVGIIATVLNIYHFVMCGVPIVQPSPLAEPTAHHILLVGSSLVATALITWYAWKWPKQEARAIN